MAKNKTTETDSSVADFINSTEDARKQADSFRIVELMQEASGFVPKMWGPSIIGFGTYHYKYASGHEGDAPLVGFSPRKKAISLYLMPDPARKDQFLSQLGKFKITKACIYVNKLDDIDQNVLKEMIADTINYMKELYP